MEELLETLVNKGVPITNSRLSGIIPAAGLSNRMNSFKPLLLLGQGKVIEHTIDTLFNAGIQDIRVIVGFGAELIVPVLESKYVKIIFNRHFRDGMFASIKAGVKTLEKDVDGFFLLPADIPAVKSDTLVKLTFEFYKNNAGLVYPCFQGKRGHPPLVSTRYCERILTWSGSDGMRGLLRELEPEAINLDVDDPGIHLDIDTPEDYARLCEYFEHTD